MADDSQPRRKEGAFPFTSWTTVEQAGEEDRRGPRLMLNRLLLTYLPALRAH